MSQRRSKWRPRVWPIRAIRKRDIKPRSTTGGSPSSSLAAKNCLTTDNVWTIVHVHGPNVRVNGSYQLSFMSWLWLGLAQNGIA
jgi:hypothetical protein